MVIGQVDRAAGTHGHIAAVHTGHHTAGAAPVEKEDGLPSRREILPQRQQQRLTDGRGVALLQFLLHVDDLHRRQGLAVIAAAQLVEGIDAGLCSVHRLHAGRGGPQKHQRLGLGAAIDSHLPGMIAGGVFGFIGVLLLLIHNEQAKILRRRKDRRAGAENDRRLPGADALPGVVALGDAQAAVEHRHLFAEMGGKKGQKLRRQSDLRHQQQGRSALFQAIGNEPDIDRRFAAAGNAVEQRDTRRLPAALLPQALIDPLLLVVEHQRAVQSGRLHALDTQVLLLRKGQIAQGFQTVEGGVGGTGVIAQLLGRALSHRRHQLQHCCLQRGGAFLRRRVLECLLRRRGEDRNTLRFVLHAALPVRFASNQPLFQQIMQGLLQSLPVKLSAQQLIVRRAAQIAEGLHHRLGHRLPLHGFPPVFFGNGVALMLLKPDACRQDRLDGVIKGAEIPLPQESRHMQRPLVQQRFGIQHPVDGLEPALITVGQGQDHALGALIGPAERDADPRPHHRGHPLGNAVTVRLVNGVDRSGNGNFRYHFKPACVFSVKVLFVDGRGQLTLCDLADGQGHGLVAQGLVKGLGLDGDLTGAAGYHVDHEITAVNMLEQLGHCGIQHISFPPCIAAFCIANGRPQR